MGEQPRNTELGTIGMTAEERVRERLRPDGTVNTERGNAFSNSLHDDLTEMLADYRSMCELAISLADMVPCAPASD
jgi:ectoine hydroxylase-related dioxygenase (phytanoyl-CoA dioxygenase family)